MRVVGAFTTFNADYYDVEKYYVKWFRLLGCDERT